MPGGVIVGDSSLCCCGPAFNVMCDVNCSSAITSHRLLILHKRSRPHSVSDFKVSNAYTVSDSNRKEQTDQSEEPLTVLISLLNPCA